MYIELFLPNEDKTIELGFLIGKSISPNLNIYILGDLGAGKTYISKGIAKGLGLEEDIVSPTFTLINHYKLNNSNLYHLDLYRLNSLNEILNLGIEDFIDNNSIVLIEWAEKLENYKLTNNLLIIELKYLEEGRLLSIKSDNIEYKNLFMELENFVNTWN